MTRNDIWLKIEDGESQEAFVTRCKSAVRAYHLPRIGPDPVH